MSTSHTDHDQMVDSPQSGTKSTEAAGYLILVMVCKRDIPQMEAYLKKHPAIRGGMRYKGLFPFTVYAALTPEELERLRSDIQSENHSAVLVPLLIEHNWELDEVSPT
jgi:hypothetical protein